MLGVNSDEDLKTLRATLGQEGITWRSWWDNGSKEGPIQKTWQVRQRPTIHLIDGKGVIRFKDLQAEELDEAIELLIAEIQKQNN